MTIKSNNPSPAYRTKVRSHSDEQGIALITALMMMLLLSAIALTVLAVVRTESHIAGADLKRTQTFYCAASAIEKMTSDFGALYARTSRPTQTQLDAIAALYPTELVAEGFDFTHPNQSILPDNVTLAAMRTTQGISAPSYPRVTMPANSPFGGLIASVNPFILTSTCTYRDGTQVALTRNMNNYLIPLFQFGMFSDEDIELHPGPAFTFNGRVHANGNIYVNGDVTFLDKVTTANEFIYDVLRNNSTRGGATVSFQVGAINVKVSKGSMNGGPNITTAPVPTASPAGQRGYFPGSPDGTINTNWNATSVAPAALLTPDKFGGQLLTRTTGAAPLKLPLQLDNNPTRELIKRRMPNDSPDPLNPTALSTSRYHTKAEIRILIDDEDPKTPVGLSATDASGIPTTKGVLLSTFNPIPLPKGNTTLSTNPTTDGAGRALWRVNDLNNSLATSYNETATSFVRQEQAGALVQADTVRGVRAAPAPTLKNITGATNASPIVVTSVAHGYSNGDRVFISGVGGNTAANGLWTVSNVAANTFRLVGSTGNGTYTVATGKVYSVTAVYNALPTSAVGAKIPGGAGLSGRIWIQIVDSTGAVRDVTEEILSLGMTEGEPNTIVTLQRPLWTAFTQGSRDADNNSNGGTDLPYTGDAAHTDSLVGTTGIFNTTHMGAIGEISTGGSAPTVEATYGYLTDIRGPGTTSQATRSDIANYIALNPSDWAGTNWSLGRQWNAIVPINLYNVREGHLTSSVTQNAVYERGITNVVEINMRNLARWMDGVYDLNLLAGTNALSANIAKPDGYVVYVSDRRGDKVKSLVDSSGATINSTNGMVDNVDIYGPNGNMDAGEDVQARGTTVGSTLGSPITAPFLKDTTELPDPVNLTGTSGGNSDERIERAISVAAWTNPNNYFRRSVRVFNADNLRVTGATGKLSTILGITISSENMVYIWGNYNTAGINDAPPDGTSSFNESTATFHYCPGVGPALSVACASTTPDTQVPSSIVADAIFPLSRTWFDSVTAMFPDDYKDRPADRNSTDQTETAVRAGVIAGNNLSALDGTPDCDNGNDSRLSGGMHNFPRFLENWLAGNKRWNFAGSFIPLYHSTQALGQWWYVTGGKSLYGAPIRNWAFDITFTDPAKLPPGTPQFQHVEPTGFRQIL